MAVTIKELAKKLDVSSATISRALNREKGVTEETRRRVVTLAKELNYQPNLQAKGLVAKKTNSIGVIIPQTAEFAFANTFYSEVLKGIIKAANQAEYFILLSLAEREDYARSYRRSLTSGLIVIANRLDDPKLKALEKGDIPVVLTPGYLERKVFPSVDVDNTGGFFQATSFLIRLGHQKIGLIDGPQNSKISIERKAGYLRALKESGSPQREDWIFEGDFSQEAGVRGIQAFLNHPDPPTAILTVNDFTAIGALYEAKRVGLKIPADLSIVGFGDIPFAPLTDPPLTTVRAPYEKLGETLTKLTINLIEGRRLAKKHARLPVELVERKSTSPAPPAEG
jgi:LacI family transcriptional regulator